MRLKFAKGVRPTREQALEVAQVVMVEPDMGWKPTRSRFDTLAEKDEWEKKTVWTERCAADGGTYVYRVNLKKELITILKIED